MRRTLLLVATLAVAFAGRTHAQPAEPSRLTSAHPVEELTRAPNRVAYNPPIRRLWISAGGGFGGLRGREEGDIALAGQVSAHWQRGRRVLSLRAATVTDICIGIGNNDDCEQQDVGLLIGWGTTGRTGLSSIGVGVAAVRGGDDGETVAVGLPLQIQFLFDVGGVAGLGLYGFANINAEQSFGGVTLSLSLGDLQ